MQGNFPKKNIFIFFGTLFPFSCMIRVVFEPGIIQGRFIGEAELAQVRLLLSAHGDWSRWRVSRHLALLWEWRSASGQLKDMAARTLLLKLEDRGLIVLPPRRKASPIRRSRKPAPEVDRPGELFPEQANAGVDVALAELLPLGIEEISRVRKVGKQAEFSHLLGRHHYLGHRGTVGENMQYLVSDARGTLLACVLFGAAAWQCKARDSEIGWNAATRARRLSYVTNNTRFLILPWVRVPHLASHVLGRISRRLSSDWQGKYGHPIHLLETFVDTSRFAGTCYRAANWRMVGVTTGRTRQNKTQIPQAAPKAVWLYPLQTDFREALCAS
jgi:hypothetical protein